MMYIFIPIFLSNKKFSFLLYIFHNKLSFFTVKYIIKHEKENYFNYYRKCIVFESKTYLLFDFSK